MTQEDKDLLIKDLCARLPYGVIVQIPSPLDRIDTNLDYNIIYNIENGDLSVKPYLFPLSSMTDEQKKEYFDICRNDWIDNKSKDIGDIEVLNKGVDWLNAHHFDYRGLIDKGFAIDATNLNIY